MALRRRSRKKGKWVTHLSLAKKNRLTWNLNHDLQPIYLLSNVHGKVIIGPEHIAFQDVPIIAPSGGAAGIERGGEVLLKGLTLEVKAGQHMLVTGAK